MAPKKLTDDLSVSPQILPADVAALAAMGFKSIIGNRPDGEGADQPSFSEIEREAQANGLAARYIPIETGKVTDANVAAFEVAIAEMPKPILAYCRSGTRSSIVWALSQERRAATTDLPSKAGAAGNERSGVASRVVDGGDAASRAPVEKYDIVIVGGGAAGTAVAGSLLARKSVLNIAIIEPADVHYYQPGWTLVGGGVFTPEQTARSMGSVLPRKATWIKAAVAGFDPNNNSVVIEGSRTIRYDHLIVCPGLKLNWGGVEGLTETLGKNGVTSNYRYDLAPYTWELVKRLKSGRAIFTQPPMPIKCAGAPQKAMYLSADHWLRSGRLDKIAIEFDNAGGVLFGVADYVPALMNYIERYRVQLNFGSNLVAVDGPSKRATFSKTFPDGATETVETSFEMMHVCPPQIAPDFIRASSLADAAGWVDVDPATLRHKKYANIFALGDVTNTPNAKTAAAARKQAPVVAENLLHDMGYRQSQCVYDGYGSCPLTVERGKIVLAEFTYGGKLAPSFPLALLDGRKPSRLAWILKERILPPIYWQAMLKGREWMAKPKVMA